MFDKGRFTAALGALKTLKLPMFHEGENGDVVT